MEKVRCEWRGLELTRAVTDQVNKQNTSVFDCTYFFKIQENRPLCDNNFL